MANARRRNHSNSGMRCKTLGVPTRLVVYAGEGHSDFMIRRIG